MVIHVATDHTGLVHKEALLQYLTDQSYDWVDHGATTHDPTDDYPTFIYPAAAAVSADPTHHRAIIFGGSGQGEAMAANRFPAVRATVYYGHEPDIIDLSRTHNDANILSIGARFVTVPETLEVVAQWLAHTDVAVAPRHQRRIEQLSNPPRSI